MMRAALTFIPMSIFAIVALDVAVPAFVLLACVLATGGVASIGALGARGAAIMRGDRI
ncbi:hypothetical protein [Rhizobium sp. 9140]|uniref:hypothetical protein n=1 Tax=Rhizobium sp. 9140 TaxID=1761900 RepID=UPI000791C2E5|nr:hypothetical protein [Rhizobium sp. 9140]CZT34923.1 hypothetical protein GA0004734_00019360 [Rhizobium sp. 9140]